MTVYDRDFFDAQKDESSAAAKVVVPIVFDALRPLSVLDVGTGIGGWVAMWHRVGVADAMGVDGDYVDRDKLLVDPTAFQSADLSQPISLGRQFDLVQSLEVAEHIDESKSDVLIENLTSHGDVILFSAAIPGQGGTDHVNEQWPSYWAAKFEARGFSVSDSIRRRIWNEKSVPWYYRQNMFLYYKGTGDRIAPLSPSVDDTLGTSSHDFLDIVHPDGWKGALDRDLSGRAHLEAAARIVVSKFRAQRKLN